MSRAQIDVIRRRLDVYQPDKELLISILAQLTDLENRLERLEQQRNGE